MNQINCLKQITQNFHLAISDVYSPLARQQIPLFLGLSDINFFILSFDILSIYYCCVNAKCLKVVQSI